MDTDRFYENWAMTDEGKQNEWLSKDSIHFIRYKECLNMVSKEIKPDSKILDVGCGEGNLISILPKCEKYGVDVSSVYVKKSGEKNPDATIKIGNADMIPFEDQMFDFVFCTELIEHVQNPKNILSEISRITKKQGVIIFSTYNHYNFGNIITLKAFTDKYVSEDHLVEYNYFSFKDLIKNEMFGFKILDFACVGYGRILWQLLLRLNLLNIVEHYKNIPSANFMIFKCKKI